MGSDPTPYDGSATDNLDNLLTAMEPGGIERQEWRGQRNLVHELNRLPIKSPWEELEKLGFERVQENGDTVVIDDVFCQVTAPEGWTHQATDHSMWSALLDPQGRKRAEVFFKAAFYDKEAFLRLVKRFSYDYHPEDHYDNSDLSYEDRKSGRWRAEVDDMATDKVVFSTEWDDGDTSENEEKARASAQVWLNDNYPDFLNPVKYWD